MFHSRLKGKDRLETVENYCIVSIFLGAIVLSLGIGLSVINGKLAFVLAMPGALVSFFSTVVLIFTWLVKEFVKK